MDNFWTRTLQVNFMHVRDDAQKVYKCYLFL